MKYLIVLFSLITFNLLGQIGIEHDSFEAGEINFYELRKTLY